MIPPQRYLVRREYSEFERFADETKEWDLDFVLLDKGGFDAQLLQFIDLRTGQQFGRPRLRARLKQAGAPPLGLRTFVVPAEGFHAMEWRRHSVTGMDIMAFPIGGELLASSGADFDVYIISVTEERIRESVSSLQLPKVASLLRSGEVFRCDAHPVDVARSRLARLEEAVVLGLPVPEMNRRFDRAIDAILTAIVRGSSIGRPASLTVRGKATSEAEAFIVEHAREVPTVREICRQVGVSYRTLEYGFKERFGVTPERFIKSVRLHGIRKELRRRPSQKRISDLANGWGFWHMGQFAHDYKSTFGELPSQTS